MKRKSGYKNIDRHDEILDILQKTPYATVDFLANELHISQSSVRRDLAALETRGAVVRSRGGVSLKVSDNLDIPFELRMQAHSEEKKLIAAKAAKLIEDGNTVFIDASTTVMYLGYELVRKRGLTVITNGINILYYLQPFNIRVVCTGGILDHADRAAMVGNETVKRISEMRADIVFFSPQAIDGDGNMFDCYPEEIASVQAMIACASKKVCLCDSSKIGNTSSFKQTDMSQIDILVCDTPLGHIYGEKFPHVSFI